MKTIAAKQKHPILSEVRSRTTGDHENYLFGRAVYPVNGRHGPRIQKVFQLIVLTRGELQLTLDDIVYELLPGQAILLFPGGREFFRFSSTESSVHTWCQVSAHALSRPDRARLLQVPRAGFQAPSAIHLLIDEGLAAPQSDGALFHEAMTALSRASLLRFAAHAAELDRRNVTTPIHPAVGRALELAAGHFAELRSGEELARRVGVSASRLRMLCRQANGESPRAMIWRFKVEHALQLIRSSGLSLGEIAEACGYANPFHLSRSVRAHTGQSPRQIRQAEWKKAR